MEICMAQNKYDFLNESKPLIYFQNLIPGTQDSPFIDRYKQECLTDTDGEHLERKQLLNEFPPVLSFSEKQKKAFYDKEAVNCAQFCCGAMGLSQDISGNTLLQPQDHYMLSVGSGKLYEGRASDIKSEMQEDIHQAAFGSPEQQKSIDGFKQFEEAVTQRGHKEPGLNTSEANQSLQSESGLSPFQTIPKPIKE